MHRLLSALMIMLAAGAIAPVGTRATAAQPASTTAADRALLARRLAARGLSAVSLNGDATLEQLTAALGLGGRTGPAGEMLSFSFGDDNDWPHQQLWLSFEASGAHRLTRAILLTYHHTMASTTTELFNALEITRGRRPDQLDYRRLLTVDDVFAVWGPPDAVSGSGFAFWEYRMVDGGGITLVFDGRCLLGSGPQSRRAHRARRRLCHAP